MAKQKLSTHLLLVVLTSFLSISCMTTNESHSQKNQTSIINWTSSEGVSRLEESKHKVDFFKLANNFESQSNKVFCGPASAAIVLNALRVRKSKNKLPTDTSLLSSADKKYLPKGNWSPFYERYTQHNIFTKSQKPKQVVLGKPLRSSKGKTILNKDGKPSKDFGFQIRQFGKMLEKHGLRVNTRIVTDKSDDKTIKNELIKNLKNQNDYIIANYSRKSVNQPGGGHISPVAAYHQPSDSFLVLDVTPNKADWVWVPAKVFISAMRTFDTVENRGYVTVSEGQAINI